MQGDAYGVTNNFMYPRSITNPDEMSPYIYTKPNNILSDVGSAAAMHGGHDMTLQKMDMTYPRVVQPPQIKIGAMLVNHVYPEGAYGNQKPPESSTTAPVPVNSTFTRPSFNFY